MLIRNAAGLTENDVTPHEVYLRRREFMAAGLAAGLGLAGGAAAAPLAFKPSKWSTDEKRTKLEDITSYNNFYEFGVDKDDPAKNAGRLKTSPWSVVIEGECAKPGRYALEDILKTAPLEERIYRLRCVEGWSMVIPWIGLPLAALIGRVQPTSKAKFVSFETLIRPDQMIGQRSPYLDWPYREGLRIDEAVNPLTILAVGLYGQTLPNQNGAPIRLVVPWKYGFKSIKSVVKIRLQETQPKTTWQMLNAREYGFYSNVNPAVDHPRWSQANERRIGEFRRRETLLFNGYGDQVAGMYRGMDLRKFY